MANRVSRLLGACALASLMGCASEPSVSSLTSAERQRVAGMVVVKAGAIPKAGYQILGSVEGLSCKYTRDSASPTMEEAMQGVRIRAAKLGADAVTNMVCEDQRDGGRRNCWQAVVCIADAITVTDKSMLSHSESQVAQERARLRSSAEMAEEPETQSRQLNNPPSIVAPAITWSPPPLGGIDRPAVVGGQVLSPSGNNQSKQRQPVENMNRCKQIRVVKGSSYDVWEFFNNCPVPVSVAYCEKAGCKSPISSMDIPAGSKYKATILNATTPEPGAVLYCPVNSFNTTNGGVWACWPKR